MLATRMRMAAAGVTGTPAAGWWLVAGKTCVAAYQPIGAASLAASYTNLANPGTYDAAPGTAPTHASATGWGFVAASSTYLVTGVVPALNQSWTMLIRYSDLANALGTLAGTYADTAPNAASFMVQRNSAANAMRCLSGGITNFSNNIPGLSGGVYGFAGTQPYRNGSAEANVIPASSGAGAFAAGIAIGALQYNAAARVQYVTSNIQAVAIYSDTLSGAEVATLSAAMAALT